MRCARQRRHVAPACCASCAVVASHRSRSTLSPTPRPSRLQMGKMPDGKVMYTLDGRPVTEEPEGSPEEKHYKRIINQVGGREGKDGWGVGGEECREAGWRAEGRESTEQGLCRERMQSSRACTTSPCHVLPATVCAPHHPAPTGVWLRARDLPADDADSAQGDRALHGAAGAAGGESFVKGTPPLTPVYRPPACIFPVHSPLPFYVSPAHLSASPAPPPTVQGEAARGHVCVGGGRPGGGPQAAAGRGRCSDEAARGADAQAGHAAPRAGGADDRGCVNEGCNTWGRGERRLRNRPARPPLPRFALPCTPVCPHGYPLLSCMPQQQPVTLSLPARESVDQMGEGAALAWVVYRAAPSHRRYSPVDRSRPFPTP